ncbi:STN domain-containing protein [Parabacteroides goldsteinii]|nr:SusC/RagA family TonB-linked outer membrane protein [Parabacteroides goldsteinii]
MRITLLLLLFVTYGWANEATYAQVTEIHLSSGNKTLQEVFSEIEGKTEFIFFYNDNAIDLSKKVHVEKSHGSINEILDNLLEGSGADYKIVDRQVIFYKKKQDPEVRLPQAVVEKKQITGLVLDEHKLPVIGANVVEKGTTNGTVTDLDGKFTLAVQDNAVLLVSYIGYITQEIPVKGNRQLNITLQEDSKSLDEVVVVGYGTQKKVNLTGSVDVIT